MRIGMLVPGGVDRSGTHRVIPELVERLSALSTRHDLHVVALGQEDGPGSWELVGARIHDVGRRRPRLRALAHLRAAHRRAPFDVLHGYALVPQGGLAAVAGRHLGVPWVVEAPGGEFASLPRIDFGGWRRWQGRRWIGLACSGASAVVVPSEPARRLAAERGIHSVRIPLALSPASWPRAASPAVPAQAGRLAWIGSLNRVKSPSLILEVVAGLLARGIAAHVDVVGEVLSGCDLVQRARAKGLAAHVHVHGFLPQDRVRRILEEAALLLVTSRSEAGPRVVLEAASLGIPAVGTAVGYLEEWSPTAALAVADPDPRALVAAVAGLLGDESRRQAMGRAALARLGEHDPRQVAHRWEAVYGAAVEGVSRG